MKLFARALTCFLILACISLGAFGQTQVYPSGIPQGSATNGYGPWAYRDLGNSLSFYKMLCFENGPAGGSDLCLFRDYAGHLTEYTGSGQQFGTVPTIAGTFDNVPATAVAITTTNFTALVGPLTITSVAAGGVYTGTITGGTANALVGLYFNTAGFTNGANNKVMALCTASTATTLTLQGATIAETATATAAPDIPLLANSLGIPGKRVHIHADGVYTTAAASLLNVQLMLCQISGCGSGTIVTPAGCTVTTTNQANVLAAGQWNLDCSLIATPTVGASGTFWAKSMACVQLGAATTAALSCFADVVVAASAAVDETKNQFANIAFKFTTSNAGNTATLQSYSVDYN